MIDQTLPADPECSEQNASDRRRAVRFYYRRRPMVQFLVRPSFQCGRAFVKDLSHGGIGLLVNHAVQPGTVLFIQMKGVRRGTTRTHLATVVHLTQQGPGAWLLGCRLNAGLSDDELQQALHDE